MCQRQSKMPGVEDARKTQGWSSNLTNEPVRSPSSHNHHLFCGKKDNKKGVKRQ